MSAHASAHGWQIALGAYDADSIAQIALLQFVNPVGYVIAYRTPLLTLGHLTMQTALSLLYGFSHGVALIYFIQHKLDYN
jgi:hypothetical protein